MIIPDELVYYWLGESFPHGRIAELHNLSVASINIRLCRITYEPASQIIKIAYDGDFATIVIPALHFTAQKALNSVIPTSHMQTP